MTAGFKAILVKLAVFVVLVGVIGLLLYNTLASGVSGGHRSYSAVFSNVSGLAEGADVRVAGVRVGRVTGVAVDSGHRAKVDFELVDDQPLLSNSGLVLRYQSLLGQRYLAIVQPARHGSPLPAGSEIPAARTSPGFDLTDLLDGFRPLFQTLDPDDVNRLATSIVHVLQGEGGTIDSLLQQTARATTYVADRDQVIDKVITNLTPVLHDLAGQGDQIKSTVHELRLLMTGLASDRKEIGRSIDGLSTLIGSTSDLLAEERGATVATVKQFRAVTRMLEQSLPALVRSIQSFSTIFGSIGRAASYENGVNIYLCTTWVKALDLDVNLAGGSGGPWSKVCR